MAAPGDPQAKIVQGSATGTPLNTQVTDSLGNAATVAFGALETAPGASDGPVGDNANQPSQLRNGTAFPRPIVTPTYLWDGSAWNRQRANEQQSVQPAGTVKTTTYNTADIDLYNARGFAVFIDVSAIAGSPTMTVQAQSKDPVSGNYVNIPGAVTAAIVGISTSLLTVYPGVTVVANQQISAPVNRKIRFAVTIGGTTPSFTFSIGLVALV